MNTMSAVVDFELNETMRAAIENERQKFPPDQPRSSIMGALKAVQAQTRWLQEAHLRAVAAYLDVPVIWVSEVATFYSMFHLEPVGQFELKVCASISCHLCGAHELLSALQRKLGIGLGETSEDGRFTVNEAECLAACVDAPVLIVNDQVYHRRVDEVALDKIISDLQAQPVEDLR